MDKASQVLAQGCPDGVRKSFRALADHSDVARTTLQHRARGRRSNEEKARSQHYLHPWEEKALVKFLAQQDALGRSVRIKHVASIAFSLARQRRTLTDRPSKPPGKNWPRSFCKRHPELQAKQSKALDWKRYDIRDKVIHWFEAISKVLEDADVLQENVYNMDEREKERKRLRRPRKKVRGKRKRNARGFEEPGCHANPHGASSGVTGRARKRKSDAASMNPPEAACARRAAHKEQESSVEPAAWACSGQETWHTIMPILSPYRAPMAPMWYECQILAEPSLEY